MPSSSEGRVAQASGGGVGNSLQGGAIITDARQHQGTPPQVPELLSQSELTLIFMKSCSRKNMSEHLTRRLFSEQVHMTSNVFGRKKRNWIQQ